MLEGAWLWVTPEWMVSKWWPLHVKQVTAEPAALVLTGLSLNRSPKGTSLFVHNLRVLAAVMSKNVPWEP